MAKITYGKVLLLAILAAIAVGTAISSGQVESDSINAPVQLTGTSTFPPIIITEVRPLGTEYIGLDNVGTDALNLRDFRLVIDGQGYNLAAYNLLPGHHAHIVTVPESRTYEDDVPDVRLDTLQRVELPASNGKVELIDSAGQLLSLIWYGNGAAGLSGISGVYGYPTVSATPTVSAPSGVPGTAATISPATR